MNASVIQQLENHHLGALEAAYTSKKETIEICIVLAVLGVLLLLGLPFFTHTLSDDFLVLVGQTLVIGLVILMRGGIAVYLCSEGLLFVRWDMSKSLHWESISEVQLREVRQTNYNPSYSTPYNTYHTSLRIFSWDRRSSPFISFPEVRGVYDALRVQGARHGFPVVKTSA